MLQWCPLGAEQMSFSVVMGNALGRRSCVIATITAEMALMSLTVVSGENEVRQSRVADSHAWLIAGLRVVGCSSRAWRQLGFVGVL